MPKRTVIITHTIVDLAPLEYRYALDAAMSVLGCETAPAILCHVPELEYEVCQRLNGSSEWKSATAGLWIEPLGSTWISELERIAHGLICNAQLVILASRPMANLLSERKSWTAEPLGTHPGGLPKLYRALSRSGFILEKSYGIHSILAISLNLMSRAAARCGRPDLGDRLQFAARLRYCTLGPLATLSTLALLFVRKISR
ncbi:MAG TPA: hypothetical protein VK206_00430 [Anaerolineales bacterium]|nr:hypothetical protein [Anaerolineales bacterium]HLO33911.1 hypothetical protein [Anaerolineales bacterium]